MKKLLMILPIFILNGCSALGLDPYTNLTDPKRSNISYSSKTMNDTESCLHKSWSVVPNKTGVKYPLTITYNQNGKVLAFIGMLGSRFFAIEISESDNPEFKTKLTSAYDPIEGLNPVIKVYLPEILDKCSTRSDW